jgi:glucose/arabinose dehydrogenase
MHRKYLYAALLLAALVLCCVDFRTAVVTPAGAQTAQPQLALVSPLGGLSSPVGIVNAADGSNRLFVVEQGGRIRIIKNGALLSTPFLDISTRISTGGERGLLGLAFPPGFATGKRFYVYYTNGAGNIVIARYRVSAGNADVADLSTEQVVITIPHPTNANHNGGQLAFSPQDGFLYAGTGDGGSGDDPPNNAQNTNVLLGKILRIDVETGNPTTYTVPASNPFVGRTGVRPEIWALGVRNPWRFSFDRQTKDLYIADVGQGSFEEIDFQPAASAGGENYGWRVMEGFHCHIPNPCNQTGLTLPVVEYDHSAGDCSVTGGYVYRGAAFPRMQGLYFYGDFCTGRIWSLRRVSSAWQSTLLLDTSFNLTAFGEDEAGNLYAASYNTGEIYSVVDATPPPTVSVADASVTEGNAGQASATFAVTLSSSPDSAVTVNYHTSDGTANAPGDYQSASGSVTINPGQTAANVVVQVNGDTAVEPNETFFVNLDAVSGPATLGDGQGAGLIINDDTAPGPTPTPEVKFGSPSFVIPESSGASSIPVVRSGDPTVEMSVDYATSDDTASSRSDYTAARGTLHFAPGETQKTFLVLLTNDDRDENDETLKLTLSNLVSSSGVLEGQPSRTLTITDDDAATSPDNPVDRSDFFVRQHYLDFLNREPDAEGLAFWVNGIESCGSNAQCREVKRIDTSAAFFLSIEFQETGFLAYRVHKTAFGNLAGKPVPIRFDDFIRDAHEIGAGVVVNVGDWQSQLDRNKRSYADAFVQRAAFLARYPASQSPADYVAALNANAGGALTPAEASDLAARIGDGRETRATALLKIAEDADLRRAETNRAFVLMEYFGYLRRNPDDAPNADFAGYDFWLGKLNQFGGDFRAAEMVKAFIESIEYRQRFGP